ncbi:methionyl-tRNA formyltransferase [Lipingzhangella halophila]|uniref:Methionyl-tRNA formyltransferase n=1 Tax=Lipingzhangella halophila TaxID=1783352 RepID=A0A7W7RGB8_9ACTN|nr:methionyl-tRNA formyltransferase [Lipingzhangella halophila]MBB4930911.1 methionyl-tRNA formyltransferase [Lipingzhangella halophila]
MRLVFAGTPEAAVPSLRALLSTRHEVAAVITRPPAAAGRGRRERESPVADVATEAGLEVLKPEKASDPEFLDRLRAIAPDCCPVVAYGALLRRDALEIPPHGWVNLHFSLLPAWRGAAPVQHAVLRGDDITGATTFEIEEDLDSGAVYGTVTEPIGERDTSGDLLGRLAHTGAELLVRTLDGIESGALVARPQDSDGVSYATKLAPSDARADFGMPAMRVDRLVRACTPAPGAWSTFRGSRVKLGPVVPVADGPPLAPGQVRATKHQVLVGTATHPVELGDVQPQGKRRMSALEWARGVRPGEDERLGG